jgi:gamma-glutamyltranspeptidase/glutathione hydrolase
MPKDEVSGRRGVVSTESAQATATALRILNEGGNAADAAIAAIFTIGVTKPESCGIGGGGFLLSRTAKGEVRALDFRETSPAKGYVHRRGMTSATEVGYEETGRGVVGVPGTVKGMRTAYEQLGSGNVTWEEDLLADAIHHARQGFVAARTTEAAIDARYHQLSLFPASNRLFIAPRAQSYATGLPTILQFTEQADVLEEIARDPDTFYTGDVAEALAAQMQHVSGYEASGDKSEMTTEDLANYAAISREPVSTTYRGHRVFGVPAPAAGPTAVIEALNVLEGYDLASLGRGSAEYLHLVAEAQKLAWADRSAYIGDPAHVVVPTETLTSKEYGDQRRALIGHEARTYSHGETEVEPGTAAESPEGPQTTSLSVLDEEGNAVVITCSLEKALGSAYVPEGLGFLLNGQLYDFNEDQAGANAPAPRKRPRSSQSPMIVVKGSKTVLATGAQGGTSIPGGVLASVLHTVDFGLTLNRALDAPRAHAFSSLELKLEHARFSEPVVTELERRGHVVKKLGEYNLATARPGTAIVSAVSHDPKTGIRYAAGDPRANGPTAPAAQSG